MPPISAVAVIIITISFYYCYYYHIREDLVRAILHETDMTNIALENKETVFSLFADCTIVP